MSHMKSVVVSLHSVTRLGSAPPHAPRTPILLPSLLRKLLFSTSLRIHLPSGAVKPAAPRRQLRQCDLKTSNKFSVTRSSLSSTAAVEMGKTRKETLAYGAWKSPLTADFVSGASKRLAGWALDSEGHLIWLEGRPSESGSVTTIHSCLFFCVAAEQSHSSCSQFLNAKPCCAQNEASSCGICTQSTIP